MLIFDLMYFGSILPKVKNRLDPEKQEENSGHYSFLTSNVSK